MGPAAGPSDRAKMSTTHVHVWSVIGDAASDIESACDELLGRRVGREPGSFGGEDWSARDHRDLAALCEALIGMAQHFPILYSARYLDGWSTGALRGLGWDWPDSRPRLICGDGYDLAYYPSRDRESFLAQIKSVRRTKLYREHPEERWYVDHLNEAIKAPLWLDLPFLVVVIGQILGPTRHDEEIQAALRMRIELPHLAPTSSPES